MLPNFLIIGGEKCGTTWLYDVLKRHPDIYLPDTKELAYFNRRDSNLIETDNFARMNVGWYEKFFEDARTESAAGDISPMYLCDDLAPQRISDTVPAAKLIVTLRDPVDRAISHYWMAHNKRHIPTDLELEDVVTGRHEAIVQRGLYSEQLERYFSLFPRDQILILIFEEMMSDRAGTIAEICRFIGVDPSQMPSEGLDEAVFASTAYRAPWLHNASVAAATALRATPALSWIARSLKRSGFNDKVKSINAKGFSKPPLPDALRTELRVYYAKDRKKLETLLGRKIDAWPR